MNILSSMVKITLLFISICITGNAQQKEDVLGYWKSCDEGDNMVVRIQLDSNGNPVGYLVGFQRDDGTWEKGKPQQGIKVMYNFSYNGNLKWNKGKIYDPIAQRTYRGVVKLEKKNIIKATGYWAFLWDDILFKKINITEIDEPES